MSKNLEGVHVGFLRKVLVKTVNWQRYGTWRTAAASRVLKESGTQTLGMYTDKLQETVAEWMMLMPIL